MPLRASGWLLEQMQGIAYTTWERRWFCLTDAFLHRYSHQALHEAKAKCGVKGLHLQVS
jgi:hypothetical protein